MRCWRQYTGGIEVVRAEYRNLRYCTLPVGYVVFTLPNRGISPGEEYEFMWVCGCEALLAQAVQQRIRMVYLIQQRLHLGGTVLGRLHHRKTSQIL